MNFRARQKQIGSVALIVAIAILLPLSFAHADTSSAISGIGSFSANAIFSLIQFCMAQIFLLLGGLMVIFAKTLNLAVNVRAGGSIPVVAGTWKILRDFSNMFFIVILIYMAFATIFDHTNYTFSKMITRFIIVAVMINFSLAIGNLIIDGCQVLTNVFLGSIGDLGTRLGAYLNPALLFPSGVSATGLTTASGVSLLFALILSAIFLFSMIIATTFTFIRIPFIWGLLIVSPFAWMAWILPGTGKWWSWWWKNFVGWNLFLPVYLFFMYIGLYFLSQRNAIIEKVIQVNPASPINPANLPLFGATGTLTFNLFFFYVFAAAIMVYGTFLATKVVSALGGEGFDKGVHWATEFGHNIKGFTQVRPMMEAGKNYLDQVKKEGAPGPLRTFWRGQQGYKSDVEYYNNKIGVRGAGEKKVADDVSNAKARFEKMDTQDLRARMNTGTDFEKLAAREILKERNQLTNAEQVETYEMYAAHNQQSADKFANTLNFNKLSKPEREAWFNRTTNLELRKKIATAMATQGDYNTADQLVEDSSLFTSETDRADFMKKGAKRLSSAEVSGVLGLLGTSATREEKSALSEVLLDKQALSGAEIFQTYQDLDPGSEEGEKFLAKVKFGTLNPADRRTLYNEQANIVDLETKHKLFDTMAERGEFNANETESTARTYNGSEQKDYLTKAQKGKFTTTAEVRQRLSAGTPGAMATLQESLIRQFSGMKPDEIAALPAGGPAGADAWDNPDFILALDAHLMALEAQQGPVNPQYAIPGQPFHPVNNPIISPGRLGRGSKVRDELLAATRDANKIAYINAIHVP